MSVSIFPGLYDHHYTHHSDITIIIQKGALILVSTQNPQT